MARQTHDRRYRTDEPWKKPGQSQDESQQPNPNVVEKEKGKQRRGIVKDERGQDQPANEGRCAVRVKPTPARSGDRVNLVGLKSRAF
jgi:hypothetical protein